MKPNFETFFKANERRIHFQIHRLNIRGEWYEEFYSEGIVALWKAYNKYESRKSGNIGTYINYHIRHRLIDLLRKKIRDVEKTEEIIQAEVTRTYSGNRHRASGLPIVNVCGIMMENQSFWNEVRSLLSDNQWKWVQYFIIADLSMKEIMELEDVTADAVKGWGQAVKRKLRDEKLRRKLERLMERK